MSDFIYLRRLTIPRDSYEKNAKEVLDLGKELLTYDIKNSIFYSIAYENDSLEISFYLSINALKEENGEV